MMKAWCSAGLLLLCTSIGRGADVAKEVHDAVRDFLDLKRYAWRISEETGLVGGDRTRTSLVGAGRSEVDAFSIGVFKPPPRQKEISFVTLGVQAALNSDGWKVVEDMTPEELEAAGLRVSKVPSLRAGTPHWLFLPPHHVLVAIVGLAPAPDWIGGKILGILPTGDAAALYALFSQQGTLEWEPPERYVRNKLGAPVPVPNSVTRRLRQPDTSALQRMMNITAAQYELTLRDGLPARLAISMDSAPANTTAVLRYTWIFEFSEVGRIEVEPDAAVEQLLLAK